MQDVDNNSTLLPVRVGAVKPTETSTFGGPSHRRADMDTDARTAAAVVQKLGAAQVLVVNLRRRGDRRAQMEELLTDVTVGVQFVDAVDGQDGMAAAENEMGKCKRVLVRKRPEYVCACYASCVRALRQALLVGEFPLLLLEDDAALESPCKAHMSRGELRMGGSADLVVLANGSAPPPADDGDWLVRGSNTGNWGNAGLLVPSADSASRLVDFLLSTWRDRGAAHVDWVLQRDFVRAGGEVQHASPPLFGWRAGESDILGKHRAAKRCRDA